MTSGPQGPWSFCIRRLDVVFDGAGAHVMRAHARDPLTQEPSSRCACQGIRYAVASLMPSSCSPLLDVDVKVLLHCISYAMIVFARWMSSGVYRWLSSGV
jgi:hypothetical protein